MLRKPIIIVAVLAASTVSAIGAGNHQPLHGGKVVESGHHHLELVAADGSLTLYVRDEADKPEDVTKAKASATVLTGGKTQSVQLQPMSSGTFKGPITFKAGKGDTIVVTLTMPDHKPEQAKFKLD